MHALEHVARAGNRVLRAFDLHSIAARGDVDAEAVFDLDQVGVELAEQRAENARLIEFDLGSRATAGLGSGLRRFIGAGWFAGHALLSMRRHDAVRTLRR